MQRTLHATRYGDVLTRLVAEQVHGVAGVVPQQVIGPAARLAQRIHVRAAEEVRLHVHLQHLQFAGLDLPVDPLVARIEAARVPGHRHDARFLLHLHDFLGILQVVGHRDFDHHVLAGAHALDRLRRMHLGRCREQHRLEARLPEALGEIARVVRNAELLRDLARGLRVAPGQRDHLDAGDLLDGFQMLDAEGALTCQTHFHAGLTCSRE
jgi:hypothetical protein